jgi:hypothetical protein
MVKTMDRELSPVEAKVVASMLQALEGPALSPEVVQKVAEVAKEVEPGDNVVTLFSSSPTLQQIILFALGIYFPPS